MRSIIFVAFYLETRSLSYPSTVFTSRIGISSSATYILHIHFSISLYNKCKRQKWDFGYIVSWNTFENNREQINCLKSVMYLYNFSSPWKGALVLSRGGQQILKRWADHINCGRGGIFVEKLGAEFVLFTRLRSRNVPF